MQMSSCVVRVLERQGQIPASSSFGCQRLPCKLLPLPEKGNALPREGPSHRSITDLQLPLPRDIKPRRTSQVRQNSSRLPPGAIWLRLRASPLPASPWFYSCESELPASRVGTRQERQEITARAEQGPGWRRDAWEDRHLHRCINQLGRGWRRKGAPCTPQRCSLSAEDALTSQGREHGGPG